MRSTKIAPDFLSNSYFTGSPPSGTSMITLIRSGGASPTGMRSMFMMAAALTPQHLRRQSFPRGPKVLRGAAYEQGSAEGPGHPGHDRRRGRTLPPGGGRVRSRAPALRLPAYRSAGVRGD